MLLSRGDRVLGIDNLNDAYDPVLKRWRADQLNNYKSFVFREADIRNIGDMSNLYQDKFDAVIHLAARAGVRQSVIEPETYFDNNLLGTLHVLQFMNAAKISKLVFASTSSVYGNQNNQQFYETSETNYPLSPYASSKKSAETLIYTYHHIHGLDATILRLFTVYGPAGRPDMSIFKFVRGVTEGNPITLFGNGGKRDFTYVDDAARAIIAALRPVGYQIVNVGSEKPIEIKKVISIIEGIVGGKSVIRIQQRDASDIDATWANIERARTLLEWHPNVNLEKGIAETVEWYVKNREWARTLIM